MTQHLRSAADEVSIVLCGEAGQGIQTVEQMLVRVLLRCGFHVYATKEYMSRVRGGSNSTEIRVSSRRVAAFVDRIDILVPFHAQAFTHLKRRLSAETVVIGDRERLCLHCPKEVVRFVDIPFARLAQEVGGEIFTNILAASLILGLFRADEDAIREFIRNRFSAKGEEVIGKNIKAVEMGYSHGIRLLEANEVKVSAVPSHEASPEMLLNGAEAVGMGALAGGCNFLSSYPMSPSTGVMVYLAGKQKDFDIIVEQAEDEIAAVNMALGAAYAGARALVTTSGGGFALMGEGISLTGMIETPLVIHVAQRPGPATGLPTRTEQGDLDLVLYAGHGEFPRVILAPGSLSQAFSLMPSAFDLAERFQIPVFILTDQYFMDTYVNIPMPDISGLRIDRRTLEASAGYRRFRLTEDGVSPRGIPGGEGLVGVDSDEHDEDAHITEDLDLRARMVDKRLKKLKGIKMEARPPELVGASDYTALLVGWGSIYPMVVEAMANLGVKDLAFLHFSQVYPLHQKTVGYLKAARRLILIEGNATAQFGRVIKLETGMDFHDKILKYNGLPFSVEELVQHIRAALAEE
jgi:2-oxoglutarate ferredoxin oxidoreductase subunit alpha